MTLTRSYRPSNGTEGTLFAMQWCDRCARENAGGDPPIFCPIHDAAFAWEISSPNYPSEWIQDDDDATGATARCTAFEKRLDPGEAPRCGKTGDLFGAP